ncbi:hypothetical protein PG997_001663 [Apiospora hydei]|uniref:Uncharacterized protein n=1 Tax=Apiospora hydei TaxID=1337664 RepID=A0ABR1XEK8_9PEZI
MADSEAYIPWDLLIANLACASIHPSAYPTADLHQHRPYFLPCKHPEQGEDLNEFVEVLSAILADSTAHERKKYPEHHEAVADNDEVVIPDADAVVIASHLRRFHSRSKLDKRRYRQSKKKPLQLRPCAHVDDTTDCRCALRFEERRMSTFLYPFEQEDCYDLDESFRDAFLGLEFLKATLIYGDMNPVFRICTHPRVDILRGWATPTCDCCNPGSIGWDMVCKYALHTYIGLNFIRRFSDLFAQADGEGNSPDFRFTIAYGDMVEFATTSNLASHIPHYLHRHFVGIKDDQCYSSLYKPCGPIDPPYMPSAEELEEIRSVLFQMGLPMELVGLVLGFTGYEETRALNVPHDPFHKRNREQLDRYLGECWEVLMRCGMMAEALGDEIPWDMLVAGTIRKLLFDTTDNFEGHEDIHYKVYDDVWSRGLRGSEYYGTIFVQNYY